MIFKVIHKGKYYITNYPPLLLICVNDRGGVNKWLSKLYVEAEVHYVAVLYYVFFAFYAEFTGFAHTVFSA